MTPDPGAPDERPVLCRHCMQPITQRAGQGWWEDETGFACCVKKPSIEAFLVGHQPMPVGLRGGPR